MTKQLKEQYLASHLSGANAHYVEALYEQWLADAQSVSPHWHQIFSDMAPQGTDTLHQAITAEFKHLQPAQYVGAAPDHKQAGVLRLINAYRVRGHQRAKLDPLSLSERPQVPDLELSYHGLDDSDLNTTFHSGTLAGPERMTLAEILAVCKATYTQTVGVEYMHITDTAQRQWLQQRLEGSAGDFKLSAEEKQQALKKLSAAESMEKYLHSKYVGQKRFSLEGGESMIALFDKLINHAGAQGVKEMVIGMAHRGRLNVLVNVLGKSPGELFAEFEGVIAEDDPTRSGDVKYHLGYSSDVETPGGVMHLALAFNPSHLEIVNPVVAGSARARQTRLADEKREQVMPVLVHGDAAIAGQGVVMELLNMSQARGFAVGGTFHIVVNNQIGFTTSNPIDARSTLYCTEVAKMVQAPIFHVNGDDPEAVLFVTKVATDFRRAFKKDVVIDLVCYRRHGHNEADEPAATQPRMYQVIRNLDTVYQQYAQRLIKENLADEQSLAEAQKTYRAKLESGEPVIDLVPQDKAPTTVEWSPFLETDWRAHSKTNLPLKKIKALAKRLIDLGPDFKVHRQVTRILEARAKMADGEQPMDWGFAETLAYASLIDEGYGLRLVGQDSGRGTFFHRHAVLHEQSSGEVKIPLAEINPEPNKVTIIDSLLSEEAVLGFEYGYATAQPNTLTIWEGQFGDFVNGAQVVIDQFITSGEAKWGRLCGLVMFLPHGYEGQGPEHSSARLERFMQLASSNNIQVCVPSMPSQMFHMLRRQMLRPLRKPLIVMTPKSLLRHKSSVSNLGDLSKGEFQLVIDDPRQDKPSHVKRVVFCAGKVYFDLAAQAEETKNNQVALVRVEQLYPFPREELQAIIEKYSQATEVVWCQEEPMNQGAWFQIRHHIQACTAPKQTLYYVGRDASASPAVGYYQIHLQQQKRLVEDALTLGQGI